MLDLGKFDQSTINHFPSLLFWLATSSHQSLTKIAQRLGLNIRTLSNMLDILVKSEILMSIPPWGSSSGKIAKSYKYLFTSPAIRRALNNPSYDKITAPQFNQLKGLLLEDTIGFYLAQVFTRQPLGGLIEYDASKEGADFIIKPQGMKQESIAVEVGWRKRTSQQVQNTLSRTQSSRYGLVITDCELNLDSSDRVVFVPLSTFLLMQPANFSQMESLNLNLYDEQEEDIKSEDIPF